MYAQVSDLVDRFGESEVISLTDRDYSGKVDQTVAKNALLDASAEIDGYLGRYKLPFTEVPRVLQGYCCDIARYRLCGSTTNLTEVVVERYRLALKFLENVSKGVITLGVLPDGSQPSNENTVIFTDSIKVFGRDNPY